MKRKVKSPRRPRHALTTDHAPATGTTAEPPETRPDSLTGPGADGIEQVAPVEPRAPGQTDIERADERQGASVQAAPQADPAGVAGFMEPAGDGDPASEVPPALAQE
jgi:hypothetical protein